MVDLKNERKGFVSNYDETLYKDSRPAKYRQLLRFYRQALTKAKNLKYNVEIYSNSDKFNNIADKVHLVEGNKNKFWAFINKI